MCSAKTENCSWTEKLTNLSRDRCIGREMGNRSRLDSEEVPEMVNVVGPAMLFGQEEVALKKIQEVELKILKLFLGVTRMHSVMHEYIRAVFLIVGPAHVCCYGDKVRESRFRGETVTISIEVC